MSGHRKRASPRAASGPQRPRVAVWIVAAALGAVAPGCVLDWDRDKSGSGGAGGEGPSVGCAIDETDCKLLCNEGHCTAECGTTTSCDVSCNGADCQAECGTSTSCNVICNGSGCQVACGTSTSCNVICNGSCAVECGTGTCTVACNASPCTCDGSGCVQ